MDSDGVIENVEKSLLLLLYMFKAASVCYRLPSRSLRRTRNPELTAFRRIPTSLWTVLLLRRSPVVDSECLIKKDGR
jgi:hypothetical protein